MNEKKDSAKDTTDLAAENARLREELARAEGRASGLVEAGADPRWTYNELTGDLGSRPITDPAHYRPMLPTIWIALQHRACHSAAIMMAVLGTRSPHHRITKVDLPPWIDASAGPALRYHPDAQRVVDRTTLSIIPETWTREAVMRMDRGDYTHSSLSAVPYAQVAEVHHGLFGKGRKGHQARIQRLQQPIYYLQGMTTEQAKPFCSFWRELAEGDPLPEEWLASTKETGAEVVVYEAAYVPPPPEPQRDDYKPPTPPASHLGPGRY